MTNHHTYNHSPQVGKFSAISPEMVSADINQNQDTDKIPVRRFTAPGFDGGETAIVDLQSVKLPEPAEPQKHSWEMADERWAAYNAKQAEKQSRRKRKVAKVLGIVGIKKSAK